MFSLTFRFASRKGGLRSSLLLVGSRRSSSSCIASWLDTSSPKRHHNQQQVKLRFPRTGRCLFSTAVYSEDDSSDVRIDEKEEEEKLRYDLAVAHRLTAQHGMDMLTWNHISARFRDGCLITPGNKLWDQVRPQDMEFSSENVTADIIHDAIYAASPDIRAVMHLHTPAVTAVACLQDGFQCLTQDSAYFYKKVARYEWDGVSDDAAEGPIITETVRKNLHCNTLLMDNHGFVCFGKSVPEVWVLCYYFERACDVQLRVMQSNGNIKYPDPTIMESAARTSYADFVPGDAEWDALCNSVSFD